MIHILSSPIGRWQAGRSTQHVRAAGCHARLPNSRCATSGAGRLPRSASHFAGASA